MSDSLVPALAARTTDVCIIVEGCYPYVPGGVSAWIDWLIRSQTETSFSIVALWPRPTSQPARYALPPNVLSLQHLYLQSFGAPPSKSQRMPRGLEELGEALGQLVAQGGRAPLERALSAIRTTRPDMSLP